MTDRAQWPYWMAIVLLAAVLAVIFWPAAETPDAAPAPTAARGLAVETLDAAAMERIADWGERLPFRGQAALVQEASLDAPPVVTGVVRIGRRGFAYVEGGERAGRLAVGQSSGGWTLAAVGANYAEFSRAGEIRRVRLFSHPRKPAAEATSLPSPSEAATAILPPVPQQQNR